MSSRSGKRGGWFHLKRLRRRLALSAALVLTALVAFGLTLCGPVVFAGRRLPSISWNRLIRLEFHPVEAGQSIQVVLVPLVLFYLLSRTSLFRRVVSGTMGPHDELRLFAGLASIGALAYSYSWFFHELVGVGPLMASLGVAALISVAGGLLGGWRVGLGLGVLAVFVGGAQDGWHGRTRFFAMLTHFYYDQGLLGLLDFPWGRVVLEIFLLNPLVALPLWMGVFAGLCADLLGRRRYALPVSLLLGVSAYLGAGCLLLVAGEPLGPFFQGAGALISGVAVVSTALMVRAVQGQVAQQRVATVQLARVQAELRALRAQINPHFLFNALNTIRYFVRADVEAARRLLLHLSEVFQRALRSGEFVPLRDELRYVEAYLALEKARLDERLAVEWVVPEADAGTGQLLNQPVPTLILQPLVENAVRHGIAQRPAGGTVRVTAEQAGPDLLLQVEDDGPGIAPDRLAQVRGPAEGMGRSIGLRNVDGRLRALYGEAHALSIESQVGRGTRVAIRIPLGGDLL